MRENIGVIAMTTNLPAEFWKESSIQQRARASLAELKLAEIDKLLPKHAPEHSCLFCDIRSAMDQMPTAKIDRDYWEGLADIAERLNESWVPFGFHVEYVDIKLEFEGEREDGLPIWERYVKPKTMTITNHDDLVIPETDFGGPDTFTTPIGDLSNPDE